MSDTYTVDEAADLARCNSREFAHRAAAAKIKPLHWVRVDSRLRPVYSAADVDLIINGGPSSRLAFDLVAADLGISSAALAEVVLRHSGPALSLPARYRNVK